MPRHAKIVCTLGPATAGYDNIKRLLEAGMDVARLNFSHGDHAGHRQVFQDLRAAAAAIGKPIAVLADLCGPKIRVGEMPADGVELLEGAEITFTPRPLLGSAHLVSTSFPDLPREVKVGSPLFADDGLLEFSVIRIVGEDVVCVVKTGGVLKSKKGLNIPQGALATPALTEKDRLDLAFGLELGVDYFALSFVRRPEDVWEAKRLAGNTPIIAKIEKPQAIECLEEIADAADGLMVARGDLGVEVGPEKVPLLQKRMIRIMNHRAKPVITATQMLESMVRNPRPTRAEVSDVANAILDGTDAVMLSAESASGRYPILSVQTMARIISEVEQSASAAGMLKSPARIEGPSFDRSIAHSAARTAIELNLKAVAVYSTTGRSAALVSAYRPWSPIVGFSSDESVLRRMALYWGVTPIYGTWADTPELVLEQTERELLRNGLVQPGDEIAITFGMRHQGVPGGTNVMRLWRVQGNLTA